LKFRDSDIINGFAKKLVETRKLKNITQEDLAYSSGLSLSQIARIETARINPTLCTIVTIARSLKIHQRDLMDF
jgi:transcriptional regulator with XRE-family HTH domain